MRKFVMIAAAVLLAVSCGQQKPAPPPAATDGIQTLENNGVRVMPVDPPPMISEQDTLPKPKPLVSVPGAKPEPTFDESSKLIELPFAPAIAMDPVNGDKVSIRSDTPMLEYKNHVYYFSGADTRAEFAQNPDGYSKGAMARY
jgi:YHS domain-containing protein